VATVTEANRRERPNVAVETVLVDALTFFPEELDRLLADRATEVLTRPGSDGGWGVVENLCHLRDWEAIFRERAIAVLDQELPNLVAYDDDLWSIERDYRRSDPRRALAEFRDHRGALLDRLREIPDSAWERRGRHQLHGTMTLRAILERVREHDADHLLQIRHALA